MSEIFNEEAAIDNARVVNPNFEHVNNPAFPSFVAFQGVLERMCGITQPAALEAFYEQGYLSIQLFAELDNDGIEHWHKSLSRHSINGVQVILPHASIKKLQVLRLWAVWRRRCNLPISCEAYSQERANAMLDRFNYEAGLSTNRPDTPDSPPKFTGFDSKFRSFHDGFLGMMNAVRGVMNIPLAYVFRDQEETPQAELTEISRMLNVSSDEFLMAAVSMTTPEYKADNARAWDFLRPLLFDTPAWDYVKLYEKTKNARAAFRLLSGRGEGDAAIDARRTAAQNSLDTAQLSNKQGWTVNKFINVLVKAYSELEACGVHKTDVEKVDHFVKCIVDDSYEPIKAVIVSKKKLNSNFQNAYAYLEKMHQLKTNNKIGGKKGFDRSVSAVTSNNTKTNVDRLPPEKWAKLSSSERRAHINKMRQSKTKTGDDTDKLKKELQRHKKLAALGVKAYHAAKKLKTSTDTNNETATVKPTKSGSPADQFGRYIKAYRKLNGNKKVDSDSDSDSE
jgi:hypothetical protein